MIGGNLEDKIDTKDAIIYMSRYLLNANVLVISLVLLNCGYCSLAGEPQASITDEWDWRSEKSCGRISCYIYLKLLGKHTNLDELSKSIPINENGSSLRDIAVACKNNGVQPDILRVDHAGLHKQPFPYIAHFNLDYPLIDERERSSFGHFVVVLSYNNGIFKIADPSNSSSLITMSEISFFRSFTGYILSRKNSMDEIGKMFYWMDVLLVVMFICYKIAKFFVGNIKQKRGVVAIGAVFSITAFLSVACSKSELPPSLRGDSVARDPVDPARVMESEFTSQTNIQFDSTKKNLGVLYEDAGHAATFELRNQGARPVDLEIGVASCSCTEAILSQKHLIPGSSSQLTMSFRKDLLPGPVQAVVYLGAEGKFARQAFKISGVVPGFKLPDAVELSKSRDKSERIIHGVFFSGVKRSRPLAFDLSVQPDSLSNTVEMNVTEVQNPTSSVEYARDLEIKLRIKDDLLKSMNKESSFFLVIKCNDSRSPFSFMMKIF